MLEPESGGIYIPLFLVVYNRNYHKNYRNTDIKPFLWC